MVRVSCQITLESKCKLTELGNNPISSLFPSPAPNSLLHTEHFRHLPGQINSILDRLWENIIYCKIIGI